MRLHRWIIAAATCIFAAAFNPSSVFASVACSAQDITCASADRRTTLTVIKRVIPPNDPGRFNLKIDGINRALNVGDGGTTGAVPLSPGSHVVQEVSANGATNLCNYVTTFSGDCNAAGQVTLAVGQQKICRITNKLREWVVRAPMPTKREYFGIGVINNKIYVVGGQGGWLSTLEMYNPATNTWTLREPMRTGRAGLAVGVINGILYAVGGNAPNGVGGSPALSTVEAYDPVTNSWTTKAPMPTPREGLAVAVVNGTLYAIGGNVGPFGAALNTVEAYNPVTDTWTTKAPMPTTRAWMGTAVLNNKIYVAGGRTGPSSAPKVATVQVYNPSTNSWSVAPSLPIARWGIGMATVNGKLYAVGDYQRNEVYSPGNPAWFASVPLPTARNFLGVTAVSDVIYAIGGYNPSVNDTGKVEAFKACNSK